MSHHDRGLLGNLPYHVGVVTRQLSAENPTGAKGGGARWDPDPQDPNLPHSAAARALGRGWKVRPFIRVRSGETATLADITGSGSINALFLTSDLPEYRAFVLRMMWDDETIPSVEVPLGDFFAMGHDAAPHLVNSLPIVVAPARGCNSYWQMPFRQRARITIQNQSEQDANVVAYSIIYHLHDVPDDAAYFHAQWRRSLTRRDDPEHVIVDGIQGQGVYVGTYLAWTAFSRGWWGEGEVKVYLDGDGEFPTLAGSGTEDYFGGAWGFGRDAQRGHVHDEQEYSTAFLGCPLARITDTQGPRVYSLYRWHILDSIGFAQDLRVTVQALGWWPGQVYEPRTDDIASVAYWYQREPHAPFPSFPSVEQRWGR